MTTVAAVRARGLSRSFAGRRVVDGLDLDVAPGQCFGLLGPNGAGKTTTLRMLLGQVHPDAGHIEVLGEPVPQRARQVRARLGVVPQFDNLDPDFTVAENLEIFAGYFGIPARIIAPRLPELLDYAGLGQRGDARVTDLSGGMKRRLTLARALVNDPQMILLDEPTTGLDPQARHLIWQRLRRLVDQGRTLLLTTHFMEEAERLCDRLAILDRGRIIAQGSPAELVRTHIEPHVVELWGEDGGDDGKGDDAWLGEHCARLERCGSSRFAYVEDPGELIATLDRRGVRYLHRRSGLEDVFLKLTGRDLRD